MLEKYTLPLRFTMEKLDLKKIVNNLKIPLYASQQQRTQFSSATLVKLGRQFCCIAFLVTCPSEHNLLKMYLHFSPKKVQPTHIEWFLLLAHKKKGIWK